MPASPVKHLYAFKRLYIPFCVSHLYSAVLPAKTVTIKNARTRAVKNRQTHTFQRASGINSQMCCRKAPFSETSRKQLEKGPFKRNGLITKKKYTLDLGLPDLPKIWSNHAFPSMIEVVEPILVDEYSPKGNSVSNHKELRS